MLRIILSRIKARIRDSIPEEQYGFMEGKGSRNGIFILRMLSKRAVEVQKDLIFCVFVSLITKKPLAE